MINLKRNKDNEILNIDDSKIRFSPYLFLAFLVPAALFLAIYLLREVYPLGENSVLVLDLNAQYVYFFEELRDVLRGEGSLLYSWQRSLGGEFMGMFAYYVASPFNFLIAFFPEKSITEALLTIFTLKAGLSGFNFAVYLHYSKRAKNRIVTVVFSSMYALTAYALVNGHNTMWIDALLFLPLLILGLESLIDKRKYKLYTIMLAIIVFSNFYIGFMTCIFVTMYSIYYYMAYGYSDEHNESGEKLHLIKSILRVAFFSAIALAMAAVIIFTIKYSLTFGKNDFSDPKYEVASKFNFLEMFAKFLPNSYDTVRPTGLPFVYCGLFSLILLPIFFFAKKITPREKICAAFIISGMFISFSASIIDIFWHGLQNPNWLNYRYSFMLCFLLLVFAHQAYHHLSEIKFNHIVAVCGFLAFGIILIQSQNYKFVDSVACIWISLICVGVYLLVLYAYHKEKGSNFISLILAIIVSAELLINGYVCLDALDKDVLFSSRTSYRTFIDDLSPVVQDIKSKDDSFYRMEKTAHRKTNDNMTLDINGISSSTSTLNASVIKLLNQLGYSSKSHWSKYLGGTPASDSLLGLKYIISENKINNGVYKQIGEFPQQYDDETYYVYENLYALSIAFGVSTNFEYMGDYAEYTNPFDLINDMVTHMLGENETVMLFKPLENVTETTTNVVRTNATSEYLKYVPSNKSLPAEIKYSFTTGNNEIIYFFLPSDYPRKVSLTLNMKKWGTFFDNETDRIVALTRFDPEESVRLTVKLEDENFYLLRDQKYFYYMDTELYKEVMTKLNECRFNVEEHSDTYLKGNITIKDKEMLLFTTIPYDEGWKVTCDGVELPIVKTANSLLATEIPQGTHKLEFEYKPDCFTLGSKISILAILMFILIIISDFTVKIIRKRKELQLQEMINEIADEIDVMIDEEIKTAENTDNAPDEGIPNVTDEVSVNDKADEESLAKNDSEKEETAEDNEETKND